MKFLTRTIWVLSLISLFTDTASEMLYPVMPIYLKTIGFSVLLIGILEGLAEATAGISKAYFGKLSDISGKRAPFVQWGYSLSAISKPMIALFIWPWWVFIARTMDRLGKGLRTGARDALLSDEATPQTKGRVFGFHRSMDTMGAVLGPAIALLFLYVYPGHYKTLFFIAFLPGLLAILSSLLIRDKKKTVIAPKTKAVSFFSSFSYLKAGSVHYKKLLVGLLAFALFNSSDVFLILQMKSSGISDTLVIGIYIFYNLIFALFAFPLGAIADKLGLKTMFLAGLICFACVYFGMAFGKGLVFYGIMLFIYGVYAAATEGISKAWISNIVPKSDTATAIGTYAGLQSICALLASTIAGFLWFKFGAQYTFCATAVVALCVAFYLLIAKIQPQLQKI